MQLDHLSLPVSDCSRPRRSYWGDGAELADPAGYLIRLWDERIIKEE